MLIPYLKSNIVAGVYFHIPFCRQACRYCDFHFAVSLKYREEIVEAELREMYSRRDEMAGKVIESIYFGGGTPSVLSISELSIFLEGVYRSFEISKKPEITLEANPDDLNPAYLKSLKELGINRLSIGIQSFREEDLRLMRRSHNSRQSLEAIKESQDAGFENISIDLIYGIPGLAIKSWEKNLDLAISTGVPHLSAYHLTFEAGTVFDHWRKKGRIIPLGEEESLAQFRLLREVMEKEEYIHYEISNFSKEGFYSIHNSNYWKQVNYSGFGPSAHSYDGKTRRWNISSNSGYVDSVLNNRSDYYDIEELSLKDLYNEYILTSLRAIWGIDMVVIGALFGEHYVKQTEEVAEKYFTSEDLVRDGGKIKLTGKGIFLSDYIISDFFEV
jgi:oxygen-independent coproporphyrinogen III oxidase